MCCSAFRDALDELRRWKDGVACDKQFPGYREDLLPNHRVWRSLLPCPLIDYVFHDDLQASNARRNGLRTNVLP
jgi:hypothetical protein